jgi:DNA-directed RNA polymerase specialized sigma24 family protein
VAIDAKPAAEVGLELGLSPAAVQMTKSRVLPKLRQELGELIA